MTITYDPQTDTMTLELTHDPVTESNEINPGVILDYNKAGHLVGLEILEASKRIPDCRSITFHVTE